MLSHGKQNIIHQPEGQLIRFASRDRHTSLGIWFPIPSTDWRILMAVNENKILGPANILRDGTLTISGATGLLLLLLVWVLLSSLTRQIREKNLQLDAISSHLLGGLLITRLDRSFTILYANDGYLNMVGYTRSQLRKEKRNAAVSLCASEERNATMQAIFSQLSQNGMLSLEHRLQRRDGTRLWALIRGRQVNDPELGQIGVWVIIDVTEQKETQLAFERQSCELETLVQQVSASENRLKFLVDSASIPLWSTDLETGLISYNEHVCRMLGWPEGVLHMTLSDFLLRCHPDDVEHVRNVFESFSAEDAGGTLEYEYRVRDGNGNWRWILVKGQKAINPLTHKAERVGIVIDNHARKQEALDTLQRAAELEAQVQTRTAKPSVTVCGSVSTHRTKRVTLPSCVNFIAFPTRLSKSCPSRVGSPTSDWGTPSPTSKRRESPFSRTAWVNIWRVLSSTSERLNGISSKSILPDSTLEKSRISLMIRRRVLAVTSILAR